MVVDSATRQGIPGATVEVPGTRFSTRSGEDGSWTLGRVPPGTRSVRVMRMGYAPLTVPGVQVTAEAPTTVSVVLAPSPVPLAAMVVTPGFYGLLSTGVTPSHALTRQQLESAPQLGEDIYRAIGRLPGVSSNDMSARFSVRAASSTELYATLDGLELDEPFHLKDIDAALSILDVSSIAGLDMSTGGFTAEYGNKTGGVLNMHSVEPRTDRTRHALSLSILNTRYTGQGKLTDRGGWYVSARRGYLDIALALVSEDDSLSPRYHDVFAKAYYDLPGRSRLTLHALSAGDKLTYADGDDLLRSRYGTNYVWAKLEGTGTSRLRTTTLGSYGRLTWSREGDIFRAGTRMMLLDDERSYGVAVLKNDTELDVSGNAVLKAGLELKRGGAEYAYFNWITRERIENGALVQSRDTTQASVPSIDGRQLAAYLTQRVRIARWLTAEAGVRADEGWHSDRQLSPRLNVLLQPFENTTLRASAGRYTQAQQLHELQVSDGITAFGPTEVALHRAVALEQRIGGAMTARAEVYDRDYRRLRTRFVNQGGGIKVFPEIEDDRLRLDPSSGSTRGLEVMLQRDAVGRVAWSGSYALASAIETIGGREVPRPFDQRHTISADWTFRPVSNNWLFSAATHVHSGWPATPRSFVAVPFTTSSGQPSHFLQSSMGLYASERLPWYRRVDVRFTRYWDTRRGRVAMYADVFNLLGADNARGYDYAIFSLNPLNVRRNHELALPRLPSLGVSWEF